MNGYPFHVFFRETIYRNDGHVLDRFVTDLHNVKVGPELIAPYQEVWTTKIVSSRENMSQMVCAGMPRIRAQKLKKKFSLLSVKIQCVELVQVIL